MVRFRVSVNVEEVLINQLNAPALINDLRMYIRGWDASRFDFKNGFILGSDRYYYIVKAGPPGLIDATTNNPKWAVETLEALLHFASKLPISIVVGFREGRGVINVEVALTPREGKK
jgi:hypothetical protein